MNVRYVAGIVKRDGRYFCKVCDRPCPGRRSAYCSDDCEFRNTPQMIRHAVWKRDHGICAMCGKDCTKIVDGERRNYYGVNHQWEADHIVPVSEGGGLCGLDGYRTLCKKCHGAESGALRKRLNERRKLEKIQKESGRLF